MRDEQCGILRGRGGWISVADRAANISPNPQDSFEIDPAALLAAYRAARAPGALELLGFYHTHPYGGAAPSMRDAQGASADGKLWLIAAREEAMIWQAVEEGELFGRFDRVAFDVIIGKRPLARLTSVSWQQLCEYGA
ncbi:MAG: Mov34/MPN/PAD-1 family protein [Sphingomonas sp.]